MRPTTDPRAGLGRFAAPLVRAAATALPGTAERMRPWLGAAAGIAIVTLAAVSVFRELTPVETASLLAPLCVVLAVTGLVAARAGRATDATAREERARPARDQLPDLDGRAEAGTPGARTYLEGVERWTGALLELLAHAIEVTSDDDLSRELAAATEDTDALRGLLHSTTERHLNLNETATLHSVCALWETNQDRIEQLAAELDPAWHRRWRARTVAERLLRHGPLRPPELVLPYRT